MPTLEELFRSKKYDRLENKTPEEAFAVRNSKDIKISTTSPFLNATAVALINKERAGKAADIYSETRIESELIGLLPFTNYAEPVLYGTDILRITSQQTSLGEAMKAGTGGRGLAATAARVVGDTIGSAVQFGGSKLLGVPSTFSAKTAITKAGAAIKNTLGAFFPDVLIPSKIVASPIFTAKVPGFNEEYRVHENLANLKNFSAGTKVASFLAKNATGTPDQIKRAVSGQLLNIAQQQTQKFVSKQVVKLLSKGGDKAQQLAKELQQSQVPNVRWSSLKKYTDVVKGERQFGKPPLNFANQTYVTPDTETADRFDLSTKYSIEFSGELDEGKRGKLRFLKEKNQVESEYNGEDGVYKYSDIPRTQNRALYGMFDNNNSRADLFNNVKPYSVTDEISKGKKAEDRYDELDYVPLKFVSVATATAVNFRGTITGLSEQFSPSWDSSRFIGSPFNFYTYQSIERTVQFTFKVFSLNGREHKTNWERLGYLSSLCYPQEYMNTTGAITAPFLKFTLGDMYRNKECFIENMSYNIDDNYPWEVGLNDKTLQNYRLPMIVEVTMTLKFIEAKSNTHSFVTGSNGKLDATSLGTKMYGFTFNPNDASRQNDAKYRSITGTSTNKADAQVDPLKPKSQTDNQEQGDPYPQDSTPQSLDIQKQFKLQKAQIFHTPLGQNKARQVYQQKKTRKLYFGDGTPYTGLGSKNVGPDLRPDLFDNTNLPGAPRNPNGIDTTNIV
jgi:hypothetical protein